MICYMDRSYCASPNCLDRCGRKLTAEVRAAAIKWWGGANAPICTMEFCDERGEVKPEFAAPRAAASKEGRDG